MGNVGIKSRFKRFFELDDETYELESYDDELEEQHEEPRQEQKHGNVVSLQSVKQNMKVLLIEPRVYAEVQEIADQLKNHRAVALNLQRVPHDQAKRIVDFLSGTVYAINGDIQKLGEDTFLCTPENVDVSGSISEVLYDD